MSAHSLLSYSPYGHLHNVALATSYFVVKLLMYCVQNMSWHYLQKFFFFILD